MTVATPRRLPGFRFEDRAPVRDVLPRMDVALFAGFAARGPINVPVAIEDVGQFDTVFGSVATLALDVDRGRAVEAQLGPAVRMFFANGGRRCWVVRLAGGAVNNRFRVPGLLTSRPLEARSPGSWSDALAVGASVSSDRYVAVWRDEELRAIAVLGTTAPALAAGDLLRLTWPDRGIEGYAGVRSVSVVASTQSDRRHRVRIDIDLGTAQWFDLFRVPLGEGNVTLPAGHSVPARVEDGADSPASTDSDISLALDVSAAQAPRPGDVLCGSFHSDLLAFAVRDVMVTPTADSPPDWPVRVRGRGLWRRNSPSPDGGLPTVERLALDLWVRDADGNRQRLGSLGMADAHPRYLGHLPDDASVFGSRDGLEASPWVDAVTPRFPLAGTGGSGLFVPFGVTALPEHFLDADVSPGAPLMRDGLAPFDLSLFVDEALGGALVPSLQNDTDFLRFMASVPREPRGVHAALIVEEPTLIAVPDASQPGWEPLEQTHPLPPDSSETLARDRCPQDDFIDCGAVLGKAPVLEVHARQAADGVSFEWTAEALVDRFVLEESTSRDWRGAAVVFEGDANGATLPPRASGDYYYRVRGVGEHPTEWSNGVAVRVAPGDGWRIRRPAEYRDDVLLAVHRVLLRIAAARRDVMAVLSLPTHYDDSALAEHVHRLSPVGVDRIPTGTPDAGLVPPLSGGEADAPGFGALYDGWVSMRDERGGVRLIAPDGPACGVIARRTNERGAWIAPANELLRGVVALDRPATRGRLEMLQGLQVNAAAPLANGFALMSADTLAHDDDLRPISVRRLLILLRRMATRLGSTYVFEPNDDAFRRMVQRGFEAMLGELFERGAFAGSTPGTAFQVVTGESLNTPQSVDLGRFIVELRVAPSRPLTFVTLRLVQTGERITVTGA